MFHLHHYHNKPITLLKNRDHEKSVYPILILNMVTFWYFCFFLDRHKLEILNTKLCTATTVSFYGKDDFYPNNLTRQWLISSTDAYERIKVELKLFDDSLARGDFLEFRDGENENAPLFRRFDHSKKNLDETLLTSNGKLLYMVFRSDNEFTGAGFEITYYSEITPTSKGKIYSPFAASFDKSLHCFSFLLRRFN